MQFIKSTRAHYLAVGFAVMAAILVAVLGYCQMQLYGYCVDHGDELSAKFRCEQFYDYPN